MVSKRSVNEQLKRIKFNPHGWGKGEINELAHILLPDEQIHECANGIYEGGFALLVATDVRVLLIDKKPLNFLTVEDLRFDMINEMDYSHRLFGAQINIATGSKNLNFRSYNQPRLRKLIGHVQHNMADSKKKESNHQEGQNQHLEKINQQLQTYLKAQHEHQTQLQELQKAQQQGTAEPIKIPEPVKPSPELSDYLFAQSLLAQHEAEAKNQNQQTPAPQPVEKSELKSAPDNNAKQPQDPSLSEIYAEGMQEIFGKQPEAALTSSPTPTHQIFNGFHPPFEISPLRIAYAKLPAVVRNRKFGLPAPRERRHTDIFQTSSEAAQ